MSPILKLAAAGAALWLLSRHAFAKANPCAGKAEGDWCGPKSQCFFGAFAGMPAGPKCLEVTTCRDDPSCSGNVGGSVGPRDQVPDDDGAFMRGVASWSERQIPSSVRNDGRRELA